jgi:hypothetical protein
VTGACPRSGNAGIPVRLANKYGQSRPTAKRDFSGAFSENADADEIDERMKKGTRNHFCETWP